MTKTLKTAAVLICAVLFCFSAAAQPAEKIPVKVLILDMFEIGNNEGDSAGEFQHYYERYFTKAASYLLENQPFILYLNSDGVAGCITGMGKAQASSALTAILADSRFDFTKSYILVSGCGGMPPARGTLGDVIIADCLIDYELGHAWTESDTPKGSKATFMRDTLYDRYACIKLNSGLVKWVYKLTAGLTLTDDPKAAAYRALYGKEEAKELPAVRIGTSLTGDSYWIGIHASLHADEVCAAYKAAPYLVTQMEDNAFGVAAQNYNKLDRLIVIRDVVDFDHPYTGQTVVECLNADTGAFPMGMTNGFIAGSAVVDELTAHWDTYSTSTPSAE